MTPRRLTIGGAIAAALTIISILAPSVLAVDSDPFQTGDPVGDGFAVIPTANRIFNVNHHDPARVDCRQLVDGARCAGYGFAHPSEAETGLAPHAAIDAPTGRLWVAAQKPGGAKEIGFACTDIGVDTLATPTDCGWVTTGTGPLTINADRGGSIHSGDEYDRKLFAIDTDGTIHCVDMATAAACPGQPYDVGLDNSDGFGTHLTRIGDTSKFVARTNPPEAGLFTAGPSSVICFDAATPGVCAGWSGPLTMGSGPTTVNGSVISAQSGSTWDAFCGIVAQNVTGSNVGSGALSISCRDLSDGTSNPALATALAGPTGTALTGGTTGWQFGVAGLAEADTFGTRVYFTLSRFASGLPLAALDPNDRLVCYDYATDAVCPGYPSDFFGGAPGQTSSKTYAATVDAAGTCVLDPGRSGRTGAPQGRHAGRPLLLVDGYAGPTAADPHNDDDDHDDHNNHTNAPVEDDTGRIHHPAIGRLHGEQAAADGRLPARRQDPADRRRSPGHRRQACDAAVGVEQEDRGDAQGHLSLDLLGDRGPAAEADPVWQQGAVRRLVRQGEEPRAQVRSPHVHDVDHEEGQLPHLQGAGDQAPGEADPEGRHPCVGVLLHAPQGQDRCDRQAVQERRVHRTLQAARGPDQGVPPGPDTGAPLRQPPEHLGHLHADPRRQGHALTPTRR